MDIKDISLDICSDAEAIHRVSFDADMDKDDIAIYLHIIDVLADHIIGQTRILDAMQTEEK